MNNSPEPTSNERLQAPLLHTCSWTRAVPVISSITLHLLMAVIIVCATRTPSPREGYLELFWVSSPTGASPPPGEIPGTAAESLGVPASTSVSTTRHSKQRNKRAQRIHGRAKERQRAGMLRKLREESLQVAESERQQWEQERQKVLAAGEALRKAARVRRLRDAALRLAQTESLQRFQAGHAAALREGVLHHRDIKLILQTEDDLTVTATFVSHPASNRGRPLTKREAKQVRTVVPATVRPAEGMVESIIRKAREGIYTFIVEPADGGRHIASVALKFDEDQDTARPLGTKSITGKTVVAKVLMPEGILWNDETYFSGTIQDSEGITKYNADAGLVWKEYY